MTRILQQSLTGAGVGFLFAGPIGAAIAATGMVASHYLVSSLFAGHSIQNRKDFASSITTLLTLVAIADSKIKATEARYIGDIFKQHLRHYMDDIDAVRKIMKSAVQKKHSIEKVTSKFLRNSTYDERLWLLRLAWQVALKDGRANQQEADVISRIGNTMGITSTIQQKIADDHLDNSRGAYAALGISPRDSEEVIRKAYRRAARDNHPDRFVQQGDAAVLQAQKRFAQISEAYKEIRKERGF